MIWLLAKKEKHVVSVNDTIKILLLICLLTGCLKRSDFLRKLFFFWALSKSLVTRRKSGTRCNETLDDGECRGDYLNGAGSLSTKQSIKTLKNRPSSH